MKTRLTPILFLISAFCFSQNSNEDLIKKIERSPDDSSKVIAICKLVDQLYDVNQLKSAFDWANKGSMLANKLHFQNGIASSVFRIGRYFEETNDLQRADSLFNVAFIEFERIKNNEKKRMNGMIGVNNSRAIVKKQLGMINEAEKIYLTSIQYAETEKDTGILFPLYLNLLNLYIEKGAVKESYKLNLIIEKFAENYSDKRMLCMMLNNIGLMELDHGHVDIAKEKFKRSLELAKVSGVNTSLMLLNIASCLLIEKKYDEALKLLNESLIEAQKENQIRNIGLVLGNLGNMYKDKKMMDSALSYYKKTIPIFETVHDAEALSTSLMNVGLIFKGRKDYQQSLKYLLDAYETSRKNQLAKNSISTLLSLSEVYENLNDYKTALLYNKKYTKLKDSINSKLNQEELNVLKTKNALEKQESQLNEKTKLEKAKADAISEEKIRRESQKKMFLLLGIGLLALFTFVLLNRFRIIKKQKDIIEKQKGIVDEKQKEILDSINYAKRIQQSLLPSEKFIEKNITRLNKKD